MKNTLKILSAIFLVTFITPFAFVSCSNSKEFGTQMPGITLLGLNPAYIVDPIVLAMLVLGIVGLIKIYSKKVDESKRLKITSWLYGSIFMLFLLSPLYVKYNPMYEGIYIKLAWGGEMTRALALILCVVSILQYIKNKKGANGLVISNMGIIGYAILSSLIYTMLCSQIYYSGEVIPIFIYISGWIVIPILINWFFNANEREMLKKAFKYILAIIIFISMQILIILKGDMILWQYYNRYEYHSLLNFAEYADQKGNNWTITKFLIKESVYPTTIDEGVDSRDLDIGDFYVDHKEYSNTIYRINEKLYILFDWDKLEILHILTEKELIRLYIEEGLSDKYTHIKADERWLDITFNDGSEMRYSILPIDGKIVLQQYE